MRKFVEIFVIEIYRIYEIVYNRFVNMNLLFIVDLYKVFREMVFKIILSEGFFSIE